MIDHGPASRRPSDANAHTRKILISHVGQNRLDAIVSTRASFPTDTHSTRRNIHIIMHNHEILRPQLVPAQQRTNSPAAVIHISDWFDQDDLFCANAPFRDKCIELFLPIINAQMLCECIDEHKTNIMLCMGIFRPRIAQSCNDFHNKNLQHHNLSYCIIACKRKKALAKEIFPAKAFPMNLFYVLNSRPTGQ